MAKVPDLFEDLKNCYSENEDYSSEVDQLSLNQKSFYDASYDPLPKDYMGKPLSPSTSQTTKTPQLTFKEKVVVVAANGKILKRRRLSFHQFTDEDLEAISTDLEEEIMEPTSAPRSFQGNVKYRFRRVIRPQCTLNDSLHQSIIRDSSGKYLMAAALNDLSQAVRFDLGGYTAKNDDDDKIPVTLRIADTQLYLSGQAENEPIELQELPQTPKTIREETNLLFFMETYDTRNYFRSVAHPNLFIATKQESLLHLASGPPSITDFQIHDN